jgi:hypothetical protein
MERFRGVCNLERENDGVGDGGMSHYEWTFQTTQSSVDITNFRSDTAFTTNFDTPQSPAVFAIDQAWRHAPHKPTLHVLFTYSLCVEKLCRTLSPSGLPCTVASTIGFRLVHWLCF